MTDPSKSSILIIGAGELGHAVLSALSASSHPHSLSILLRPTTLASNPTLAATLLARYSATAIPGDYALDSAESLTATFRRFDTVIACSGYAHLTAGLQIKLAQAVLAARVRRYLPWQFGVDYDVLGPPGTAGEGMFDEQVEVRRMLRRQTGVGFVILSVGMFSTFLFEPFWDAVDFGDAQAGGSGREVTVRGLGGWDVRFTATTPEDIGRCVADVLDAWDGRAGEEARKMLESDLERNRGAVFLAGGTLSYAQFADSVERAVGSVAAADEGRDGVKVRRELWDLPYLEAKLAEDPSDGLRRYRTIFAQTKGIAWDYESSWNARRGIPTTSVEEFARKLLIERGKK